MIVAVENNDYTLDEITKVIFRFDVDYRIFKDFTSDFFELIKTEGAKIYILNIEYRMKSGIDIARKIRETDYESIIIIISDHPEAISYLVQNKLMIYAFIYKFDDGVNQLSSAIKESMDILYKKEKIIYIEKIKGSKKCLVKTTLREYEITSSLKSLKEKFKLNQVGRNRLEVKSLK